MLQRCGLASTVLRNAAYAELQVPLGAVAVTYGRLVTNAGDGCVAPISRSDCAAAAVVVRPKNATAVSKITADACDLILREVRLAGRGDIDRLARQLTRTEDKLEFLLQALERQEASSEHR